MGSHKDDINNRSVFTGLLRFNTVKYVFKPVFGGLQKLLQYKWYPVGAIFYHHQAGRYLF